MSQQPARAQRWRDVAASEWQKFTTVPSTPVSLAAALVVSIGVGAVICAAYAAKYATLDLAQRLVFDPAFLSESGILLAQVAIGVLGVLTMTAEYATGMVRTTVQATPRRARVVLSKAAVVAASSLVVGAAMGVGSFFCGQAILSTHEIGVPVETSGVWRVLFGATVYLGGIGLVGLALGTIIRRTSGAVAALFGLLLVVPGIVSTLPDPWNDDIGKFLPGAAGTAMIHLVTPRRLLAPWQGLGVFAAYVVGGLVLALVLFERRDA